MPTGDTFSFSVRKIQKKLVLLLRWLVSVLTYAVRAEKLPRLVTKGY